MPKISKYQFQDAFTHSSYKIVPASQCGDIEIELMAEFIYDNFGVPASWVYTDYSEYYECSTEYSLYIRFKSHNIWLLEIDELYNQTPEEMYECIKRHLPYVYNTAVEMLPRL